jgi:hypothetical protein
VTLGAAITTRVAKGYRTVLTGDIEGLGLDGIDMGLIGLGAARLLLILCVGIVSSEEAIGFGCA